MKGQRKLANVGSLQPLIKSTHAFSHPSMAFIGKRALQENKMTKIQTINKKFPSDSLLHSSFIRSSLCCSHNKVLAHGHAYKTFASRFCAIFFCKNGVEMVFKNTKNGWNQKRFFWEYLLRSRSNWMLITKVQTVASLESCLQTCEKYLTCLFTRLFYTYLMTLLEKRFEFCDGTTFEISRCKISSTVKYLS